MTPQLKKNIQDAVYTIVILFISMMAIFGTIYFIRLLKHSDQLDHGSSVANSDTNMVTPDGVINDQGQVLPTDFQKFNSYKKVSIYSNGLETPDNYSDTTTTARIAWKKQPKEMEKRLLKSAKDTKNCSVIIYV